MEITEVRVKLVDGGQDKLRAFCSITIDDAFVVRDLKVIEGSKGLFVAMPSRKLTVRCPRCSFKNQVRSQYCNSCGTAQPAEASDRVESRGKVHADIAHPIHTECREQIQARVVESYLEEVDASQQPGYRPPELEDSYEETPAAAPPPRPVERRADERHAGDHHTGERHTGERHTGERHSGERHAGDHHAGERHTGEHHTVDRRAERRAPVQEEVPAERTPVLAEGSEPEPQRERVRVPEPRSGRERPRERSVREMPPPDDNFSAGIF